MSTETGLKIEVAPDQPTRRGCREGLLGPSSPFYPHPEVEEVLEVVAGRQ
jgi:hypothetical protein